MSCKNKTPGKVPNSKLSERFFSCLIAYLFTAKPEKSQDFLKIYGKITHIFYISVNSSVYREDLVFKVSVTCKDHCKSMFVCGFD